jgi:predicted kinase
MILFVMIGISGSGKSTIAQKLLQSLISNDNGTVLISSDNIREELCGDASDQSKNSQVFELAHKRIEESLSRNINVIWDATNLAPEDRKEVIRIGRNHNAQLVAIQVVTPISIAIDRNNNRDRRVPVRVIWKQQGRYYAATKQEFDRIITVDVDGIRKY